MLHWKKSKKYYADKLNISEDDVDDLMVELRNSQIARTDAETASYIGELEDHVVKFSEDIKKKTGEIVINSKEEIKDLDDLIAKCKIDTEVWEITKYVQNYWGNVQSPHYQVKAWLSRKNEEKLFQDNFISFLENYKPSSLNVTAPKFDLKKPNGCLIINKQDSHLDKLDIGGDNNIEDRFNGFIEKVNIILDQASLSSNLTDIMYIIGSDEFNSEFTGTTTKGTPQKNILPYYDSFQAICDHEICVINLLLQEGANVDVIFVSGNHDEYVGWHLASWLKAYYKNESRVFFDISPRYRKYVSYGSSAIMFNHGDAIKPAKLAHIFPIEYKDEWSNHDNFYVFTGDKHHEMSLDFNGIKFYQLPAFSKARSTWDDKNGYITTKGEITGFLIDFDNGITNIFKQYL
jgi:hypothetical protein